MVVQLPSVKVQSLPSSISAPQLKPECPAPGICLPFSTCGRPASKPNRFCLLSNGIFTGICCAQQQNVYNNTIFIYPIPTQPERIHVNLNEIRQLIADRDRLEDELDYNRIFVTRGTTGFSHNQFFGGNEVSLVEAKQALEALLAFASFSIRLVGILCKYSVENSYA